MKGEPPGRRRAPRKICANFSLLRTLVRAIFAMSKLCRYPTTLSYKDAGVDIDAGDAPVERIALAKKTMREGVMAGIGGFGALFEVPKRCKEPVLVSGTDGGQTKPVNWRSNGTCTTPWASTCGHERERRAAQGAEPLFFLDYCLRQARCRHRRSGGGRHCQGLGELSGCALIGGETAEMPGMYPARIRPGRELCRGRSREVQDPDWPERRPGDVVLGLASHGVHSNGFQPGAQVH